MHATEELTTDNLHISTHHTHDSLRIVTHFLLRNMFIIKTGSMPQR